MPLVQPGDYAHVVTLKGLSGRSREYAPVQIRCSLEPAAPGADDAAGVAYRIRCRYHPDVAIDTVLELVDGTELIVKGVQNLEGRNRHLEIYAESAPDAAD